MPRRVRRSRSPSRSMAPASRNRASSGPNRASRSTPYRGSQLRNRYAGVQPQSGDDRFLPPLVRRQVAALGRERQACSDARHVLAGGGDVLPPDARQRGMRARSEPEPLAVDPVLQVVARLAPGPRRRSRSRTGGIPPPPAWPSPPRTCRRRHRRAPATSSRGPSLPAAAPPDRARACRARGAPARGRRPRRRSRATRRGSAPAATSSGRG